MNLTIQDSANGQITVADAVAGHTFAFRVETVRGRQVLEAFAPKWAGGTEPASAHLYVIEARRLAEDEAAGQGWIELTGARTSEEDATG